MRGCRAEKCFCPAKAAYVAPWLSARWGGEEFLLVFENVDLAEARKQLELLMDKIHELDTLYEGQHVKINMTFGLVCESDKDVHTLLKEADEKLYIGKTNGRNQVVS